MAAQRPWALVTGGSSGIGLAFSRQLASEGYSLALVSNRQDELSEAAKVLPAQVETLCIDLTETGAAERVLAWCDGLGLEPELLVNDAGMFFMQYLEPALLGKARAMMRLHIEALTELCILFGSRMKERGTGQIINLSSMTARIPSPGIAIYSASKAYVKSFSRGLSYELRPWGVRVLAVCGETGSRLFLDECFLDLCDRCCADRPCKRLLLDDRRQLFAACFGHFLAVVQPRDHEIRRQNDRCGVHIARQRSASGFIDAAENGKGFPQCRVVLKEFTVNFQFPCHIVTLSPAVQGKCVRALHRGIHPAV